MALVCAENHAMCPGCANRFVRDRSRPDLTLEQLRSWHVDGLLCCPKFPPKTARRRDDSCSAQPFSDHMVAQAVSSEPFELYMSSRLRVSNQDGYEQAHDEVETAIAEISTSQPEAMTPTEPEAETETEAVVASAGAGGDSGVEEEEKTATPWDELRSLLLTRQLARIFTTAKQCPSCGHGPVPVRGCSNLKTHHGEKNAQGGETSNSCPACGFFSSKKSDWAAWNPNPNPTTPEAAAGPTEDTVSVVEVRSRPRDVDVEAEALVARAEEELRAQQLMREREHERRAREEAARQEHVVMAMREQQLAAELRDRQEIARREREAELRELQYEMRARDQAALQVELDREVERAREVEMQERVAQEQLAREVERTRRQQLELLKQQVALQHRQTEIQKHEEELRLQTAIDRSIDKFAEETRDAAQRRDQSGDQRVVLSIRSPPRHSSIPVGESPHAETATTDTEVLAVNDRTASELSALERRLSALRRDVAMVRATVPHRPPPPPLPTSRRSTVTEPSPPVSRRRRSGRSTRDGGRGGDESGWRIGRLRRLRG